MVGICKLALYVLVLCFLAACQTTDVGEAAEVSPVVSPSAVLVSPEQTPTHSVMEVLPTSTPQMDNALAPTPTLTVPPFFCSYLRGRTEKDSFKSEVMREDVQYLVHLPPCYDNYADRAFPVLYLLHGWPLDESHWDNMGVDELVDDWVSRGLVGPFIIVLPGVGQDGLYVNSSGGDNSFEGMLVNELLPIIDATYSTWPEPVARAIGGISRGGVWALEIALRHRDLFSRVGAHSPALALNRPLPQYDPFRLIEDGELTLRFYLDAGDKDWARASTVRFRDALEAQGADVTYHVHEGGHVDSLWAGALADYVDFYTWDWPNSFDALLYRAHLHE